MSQIIIKRNEKVIVPAVNTPEQEYPDTYILTMNINAQGMDGRDTFYGEDCAFNAATGKRLLTQREEVRLPMWEVIQAVPEAAEAFYAIAKAWPKVKEYHEARRLAAMAALNPTPIDEVVPPIGSVN